MHAITNFFNGLNNLWLIFGTLVANIFFRRIFKLIFTLCFANREFSGEIIGLNTMRGCFSDDRTICFFHTLVVLIHADISLVKIKVLHLVLTIFIRYFEVLRAVHHQRVCAWIFEYSFLDWALSKRWRGLKVLLGIKLQILNRWQQMLWLNVYSIVQDI